jgi:hypothetical protein
MEIIKNGILVENDFTYLSYYFRKRELITIGNDKYTLIINQKGNGQDFATPFNLNDYSDPFRNDYYDVVRFVFDNYKNISIIRFKKE